jgi:FAD/FMN-containing dehydrogenase
VPLSVTRDERVPDLVDAERPHVTGGSILNFLTDPARTASAYTVADWRRLTAVKQAYDPSNVFRGTLNIPPAGTRSAEAALAAAGG